MSALVKNDRRGALRPISVAPMMDRTDRHFRALMRRVSRRALLYTEMVTAQALKHGDRRRHLDFSPEEHPIALQLGGDEPALLADCAKLAEDWGYDEVNLNVGCPSDRVQAGRFGAVLMLDPPRVAECVAAMRSAVGLPITVKHRIGVDERDSYEHMLGFVDVVAAAGADRFTVHARKAWLSGLSPRENREIPPLRYEDVHRLKAERPHLHVEVNGGLNTPDSWAAQLERVDAVMIGRAAYDDPIVFATVDARFFGDDTPPADELDVVRAFLPYIAERTAAGDGLRHITRHLLKLFNGRPGARRWRQQLTNPPELRGDAAAALVSEALLAVSGGAGAETR